LLQSLWGRDRRGLLKRYYNEFWALKELSFQLAPGQTLGVVGRNGSGKSTLLQLLCGTLAPTTGQVQLRGRVGALLELGSGFNPEFSGLENVFLNASLLGLSQAETEARLDLILGFADIGDFIHQPVKTYSSGMAVRLAFAVQAHIDPAVLVVDEALAVGDELFQKKCYAHLERLKERGTAVLLVAHSCPAIIQHCDLALLLHRGKARMLDEPAKVTSTYQRLINASDSEWDAAFPQSGFGANPVAKHSDDLAKDDCPLGSSPKANLQGAVEGLATVQEPLSVHRHSQVTAWLDSNLKPQSTEVYPDHGACITDVWVELPTPRLESAPGLVREPVNVLPFGQDFVVSFRYSATRALRSVSLACHIASHTGLRVSGQSIPSSMGGPDNPDLISVEAGEEWSARFAFRGGLWPGVYFIGGGISSFAAQGTFFVHRVVDYRVIRITERERVDAIGSCSLQAASPELLRQSRLEQ
jgi:lipopolysaccharide transport system ATP-binding protein